MCDASSVLWTLAVLAALEALAFLIWPKWGISFCKKAAKWKPKKWQSIAWLELLIAIILGVIAYFV